MILIVITQVEGRIFVRIWVICSTWSLLLISAQQGRLIIEVLDLTGHFMIGNYWFLEDDLLTFAASAHQIALLAMIFAFIWFNIQFIIIDSEIDLRLGTIDKSIVMFNHL